MRSRNGHGFETTRPMVSGTSSRSKASSTPRRDGSRGCGGQDPRGPGSPRIPAAGPRVPRSVEPTTSARTIRSSRPSHTRGRSQRNGADAGGRGVSSDRSRGGRRDRTARPCARRRGSRPSELGWDSAREAAEVEDVMRPGGGGVKILLLAPHPFYQARGTPIAVNTVLEFLSVAGPPGGRPHLSRGRGRRAFRNCRIYRIPRVPGVRNIRPGFSLKKVDLRRRHVRDLPAHDAADPLRPGPCGRGVGLHRRRDEAADRASPTSTTWTRRWPSRWSRPFPSLRFVFPVCAASRRPPSAGAWAC